MRHTIELKQDDKVIESRLDGEASAEGLCDYVRDLLKPPFSDVVFPVLSDCRQLNVRSLSARDIRTLVEFVGLHRESIPPIKHALVVDHPATFGLARMYELLAEDADPQHISVFYDCDKARKWLHED